MPSPLFRLILAWAWLAVWAAAFPVLPCVLLLVLALPVIVAIMLGMLESALLRRRALLGMYLAPGGSLYRWLRGGALMVAWQALKAMGFGLALLLAATQWAAWVWAVLALDALCLWGLHNGLCRLLATQAKPGYSAVLARHALVFLNTLIFAAILAAVEFHMPHPDYREASLAEAVYHEVSRIDTACNVAGMSARTAAAGQAAGWWLAEAWLARPELSALSGLGWLLFLAGQATFMWAYSRLLLGMLVSPARVFGLLEQADAVN